MNKEHKDLLPRFMLYLSCSGQQRHCRAFGPARMFSISEEDLRTIEANCWNIRGLAAFSLYRLLLYVCWCVYVRPKFIIAALILTQRDCAALRMHRCLFWAHGGKPMTEYHAPLQPNSLHHLINLGIRLYKCKR